MRQEPPLWLPGILRTISDEVSKGAAVKLAMSRGGRFVYIPKEASPIHQLTIIVGLEDAQKIVQVLWSGTVKVPMGSIRGAIGRRYRIEQLHRSRPVQRRHRRRGGRGPAHGRAHQSAGCAISTSCHCHSDPSFSPPTTFVGMPVKGRGW